jgi:putative glutamine amidotransferase
MTRKPLVGIGTKLVLEKGDAYQKLDRNYVRSVERAGGLPVLLPFFRTAAQARECLERLDAVLFTGGPDINPRRWGEKKHPKAELLHPDRETSDFLAIGETLKQDKPALFICCGHQELNVALGGSLHQHVYDLPGIGKHSKGSMHDVEMMGDSRTRDILGTARPRVNSWHHQAVCDVGRGLVVTSHSPDGLIEGVESPRHRFAIGVQWHPERMQDDARQQSLFRALVAEAKR